MIATLTLEGNLISCRLDNLSSVSNDHCKFNELECLCCFFWLICHKKPDEWELLFRIGCFPMTNKNVNANDTLIVGSDFYRMYPMDV